MEFQKPYSSVGKESACSSGDPSLIPGLERSAGEGIGYPLQYSWAFLALQLIKNLSAMWETWVQSLGWEDSLEKGKTIHSRILAWRISRTTVHGVTKSWTRLSNFHREQNENGPFRPVATCFPNFLTFRAVLSQHSFRFEIAQLEFYHLY